MCCADKIARWGVQGIQGTLLRRWLRRPVRLSSVVVSMDPKAASKEHMREALHRALSERCAGSGGKGPEVHVVDTAFGHTMGAVARRLVDAAPAASASFTTQGSGHDPCSANAEPKAKRRRTQSGNGLRPSAAGVSLNWIADFPFRGAKSKKSGGDLLQGTVEVTVGASGRKQGSSSKVPHLKACSRLCQYRLFQHYCQVNGTGGVPELLSYVQEKERLEATLEGIGRQNVVHSFGQWATTPRALSAFELLSTAGTAGDAEELNRGHSSDVAATNGGDTSHSIDG